MRSAEFDTTNWQLVAAACSPSVNVRKEALGEFFAAYSAPIVAWFRGRGWTADRADDLAQDFFKNIVMERRLLDGAESGRGRLRTLILTALSNHAIDAARKDAAVSRADRAAAPREADAPADAAFDAEWARTQLERAIGAVRSRLLARRTEQWRAFEEVVVGPALHGHDVRPLSEIARSLGLRDAAAVSYLVHETKRSIRRELAATISATVGDADTFASELAHIDSILVAAAKRTRP
jgi:DNA-directed RNA polymerase specialized sigma24 family protein